MIAIGWRELATVDAKLVKEFINTENFEGHCFPEELLLSQCNQKLLVDLRQTYELARENFSFQPVSYLDQRSFQHYGVFAKTRIAAGTSPPGITGRLAVLPPSYLSNKTDFSIIEVPESMLMLGPIAFVNASCKPNCFYRRDGKDTMKLIALHDILASEQLTVLYSKQFFGNNNLDCLCEHTDEHGEGVVILESRTRTQARRCEEKGFRLASDISKTSKSKRDDSVKQKAVAEFVEAEKNSELRVSAVVHSSEKLNRLRRHEPRAEKTKKKHHRLGLIAPKRTFSSSSTSSMGELSGSEASTSDEEPILSASCFVTSDIAENDQSCVLSGGDEQPQFSDFSIPNDPHWCSTPISFDEEGSFESNFWDSPDSASLTLSSDGENLVCQGSMMNTTEFLEQFQAIADRNGLAVSCREDLLKLINKGMPAPNNVLRKSVVKPNIRTYRCMENKFVLLDLNEQLHQILLPNYELLRAFGSDVVDCIFDMNIDGVPLFKSSNLAIWPVWIMIVDLPDVARTAFRNLCLMGIWHGTEKPDWDFVVQKLELELSINREVGVEVRDVRVFVKPCFLIADMPARCSALNCKAGHGYFGCTLCLIVSTREENRQIYPVNGAMPPRTAKMLMKDAQIAELTSNPFRGVKGVSPFSRLFDLPTAAPIDPMHQIFLGVGKRIIEALLSKVLSKRIRLQLSHELENIEAPYEVKRNPKSIKRIKKWKASEFKVFLLHYGCFLFRKCLPERFFESFVNLAYFTRLLYGKTVSKKAIKSAEGCLTRFLSTVESLFGRNMLTYNLHSLRHLPAQVQSLGPLHRTSAFWAESAHAFLINCAKGTRKEPEHLAEMFLCKQRTLRRSNIKETTVPRFVRPNQRVETYVEEVYHGAEHTIHSTHYVSAIQKFVSTSYTKLRANRSNCIVQLKNKKFAIIECFVYSRGTQTAIIRVASWQRPLKFIERIDEIFYWEVTFGEELSVIGCDNFLNKCSILQEQASVMTLSVLVEGFEHN